MLLWLAWPFRFFDTHYCLLISLLQWLLPYNMCRPLVSNSRTFGDTMDSTPSDDDDATESEDDDVSHR